MDKAKELDIDLSSAEVEVQWSMEGFWMPWGAELNSGCDQESRERLSRLLASDLGIPYERQRWNGE